MVMKTYLYEKMQLITTNTRWQIGLKISNLKYSLPANKYKCILFQNSERNSMNLWSNDGSNLKSCRCSNPYIHNNQQIILVILSQSHRWCLDLRLLLHSPSCSPQSRSPESENTGNIQHWSFIPAGQKQNFPQIRKDGSSQLWTSWQHSAGGGGVVLSLNCLLTDSYWFILHTLGIRWHCLTHYWSAHAHKPHLCCILTTKIT